MKSLWCGKNNNSESEKKSVYVPLYVATYTRKHKASFNYHTFPYPTIEQNEGVWWEGGQKERSQNLRQVTSPPTVLNSRSTFCPASFRRYSFQQPDRFSWTVTQSFFTRHQGFAASPVKKVNPEARKEVATFAKIFSRQKYQGTGSKYIYYIYIYILYICKKSLTRGP